MGKENAAIPEKEKRKPLLQKKAHMKRCDSQQKQENRVPVSTPSIFRLLEGFFFPPRSSFLLKLRASKDNSVSISTYVWEESTQAFSLIY